MAATLYEDLKPNVVLGIVAHPDDLDFGASGTMAAFARSGAKVYYLILTDGSKGSADRTMTPEQLVQTRHQEQQDAAAAIGLTDVFFLDYPDGMLENTMDVKRDVVRYIRRLKPDVMVTMDPSVLYMAERGFINHPDHRAAGQAALDATFPLARDHMSFPELLAEGLEPHNIKTALLVNMKDHNYAINITDTLELKLKALAAHHSQMPDFEATKTMVTEWAAKTGAPYGHKYAEGFMRIDIR